MPQKIIAVEPGSIAEQLELRLDLKPGLTAEQLDARLLRDLQENQRRQLHTVLPGLA